MRCQTDPEDFISALDNQHVYKSRRLGRLLKLAGIPYDNARLPAGFHGTFMLQRSIPFDGSPHGHVVRYIFIKVYPSGAPRPRGSKRIFLLCSCGREVDVGHVHQHVGSKAHTRGLAAQ